MRRLCAVTAAVVATAIAAAGCGSSGAPDLPARAFGQVDVSRAPGPQEEVAAAIDPRDDHILVAGSNEGLANAMRVYQSTDGGVRWSSALAPRLGLPKAWCPFGDPSLGIDAAGREYYAFLATPFECMLGGRGQIYVATRPGPHGAWTTPTAPVSPAGVAEDDDKPALAVDLAPGSPHRGRVYVVWARQIGPDDRQLLLSHSDDRGTTWTEPRRVSGIPALPINSSVAIGGDGTVYVAWDDVLQGKILLDRSTRGTDPFGPDREVAPYLLVSKRGCGGRVPIPAQPTRCVGPSTTVVVDRSGGQFDGRVYVTYAALTETPAEDVFVAAFDRGLRRRVVGDRVVPRGARVNPPDGGRLSDQFLPVAAVDQSRGTLWVCFYDTRRDPTRRRAVFSCAISSDGAAHWSTARAAASRASDVSRDDTDELDYGEYAGLAVEHGLAHPFWTDSRRDRRLDKEIYTTVLRERDLR
ncbi:MAG TPA: sialidase family protein [Gaiellaceae bacterium]